MLIDNNSVYQVKLFGSKYSFWKVFFLGKMGINELLKTFAWNILYIPKTAKYRKKLMTTHQIDENI